MYGQGTLALERGDLVESRRCYAESWPLTCLVDPGAVTQDHYMLVESLLGAGDLEAARAYAAAMDIHVGTRRGPAVT